jgi:Hemerythrin HHE cation binding domain
MPRALPSLFGRFTAIMRDHDDLNKTLRQLRAMCSALEAEQGALPAELEPPRLLGALRVHLAEHFEAEESDQYFGVVVEEQPSLKTQIAALKWAHLTMMRALDGLCVLAAETGQWQQLPGPTRDLVTQLELHEREESGLLRNLFSTAAESR